MRLPFQAAFIAFAWWLSRSPTRSAAVLLATVIGVSVLARSGRDPQALTGLLTDAVSVLTRTALTAY